MAAGLSDIKLKNTEAFLRAYMEKLEMLTKIEVSRNRTRTYPSGRKVNSPLDSTGSLKDSIESRKQQVQGALLAYGLMGNGYALDINKGTPKSKAPSVEKLTQWIKNKPVQLKSKTGKIIKRDEKSIKAIAKQINKSQKIRGIKPVPFLTEAAEMSMKHLDGMGVSIAEDIANDVEQFLKNLGYKVVNGEFQLTDKKK